MPTRSSKPKTPAKPKREGTPHDFTVVARRVVEQAIGERLDGSPLPNPDEGKNPAAVAFGRLGGAKGGKARAAAPHPCQAEGDREEGGCGSLERLSSELIYVGRQ